MIGPALCLQAVHAGPIAEALQRFAGAHDREDLWLERADGPPLHVMRHIRPSYLRDPAGWVPSQARGFFSPPGELRRHLRAAVVFASLDALAIRVEALDAGGSVLDGFQVDFATLALDPSYAGDPTPPDAPAEPTDEVAGG